MSHSETLGKAVMFNILFSSVAQCKRDNVNLTIWLLKYSLMKLIVFNICLKIFPYKLESFHICTIKQLRATGQQEVNHFTFRVAIIAIDMFLIALYLSV